ncbi:MAG: hypothetical protein ACLGHQ_05480 [Acidimicrobiia bacterium]
MDISKIKTNDWLIIGGAIGMLIFGTFLDWISVDVGFGSVSGGNAFDFFFTGTVPWILVIAAGVITFLRTQDKLGEQLPWNLVLVLGTALAAVLLIIRILFNPGMDGAGRGIGMILSVLSGLAAAAGAVMAFLAAGGQISDLTDVDKLKGAFDKSGAGGSTAGDATPPPPPAD